MDHGRAGKLEKAQGPGFEIMPVNRISEGLRICSDTDHLLVELKILVLKMIADFVQGFCVGFRYLPEFLLEEVLRHPEEAAQRPIRVGCKSCQQRTRRLAFRFVPNTSERNLIELVSQREMVVKEKADLVEDRIRCA